MTNTTQLSQSGVRRRTTSHRLSTSSHMRTSPPVTLKACPQHTPNQKRSHKQSTSEDCFQAWPSLFLVRSLRTRYAQPVQKGSSFRLLSLFQLHRMPRIHNQASFSTPTTRPLSSTSASTEHRQGSRTGTIPPPPKHPDPSTSTSLPGRAQAARRPTPPCGKEPPAIAIVYIRLVVPRSSGPTTPRTAAAAAAAPSSRRAERSVGGLPCCGCSCCLLLTSSILMRHHPFPSSRGSPVLLLTAVAPFSQYTHQLHKVFI